MAWGQGQIVKRGRIFHIIYFRHGRKFTESSKSESERDARKLLRKRLGEAQSPTFLGPQEQRLTYMEMESGLIAKWQAQEKASLESLPYWAAPLRRHFGNDRAIDITTPRIETMVSEMRKAGKTNGTINKTLFALRRMFNVAIANDLLAKAPTFEKLSEAHAVRQGFLEPAAFATVRAALPDYLHDPITFLYLTAWRKGEMKTLELRDVDLPNRVVRLRAENSKTGKPRLLMLEGELLHIFERAAANRIPECPFVFHYDLKGQTRPIGDFRKVWKKALLVTGLAGMKLVPHDLRRSGVRNSIRAGTPESVVMMQSGHRTSYMLKRYDITSEEDLRAAALRTDEYVRSRAAESSKVIPLRKAS